MVATPNMKPPPVYLVLALLLALIGVSYSTNKMPISYAELVATYGRPAPTADPCLAPGAEYLPDEPRKIHVFNNCSFGVFFEASGFPHVRGNQGRVLATGATSTVLLNASWIGRVWPRTDCAEIKDCLSGSCEHNGTCTGGDAALMMSEADFHFERCKPNSYWVSIEHGFSIPIRIAPVAVDGEKVCKTAGVCLKDLNAICPEGLAVKRDGKTVACMSSCNALRTDEACCRGDFSWDCQTESMRLFQETCPTSWPISFPSLYYCKSIEFNVQFC